ncbi:hypothetical protein PMG71_11595 [Roseofilum sp. BLCC_M154]|uniref:Uncharacterized protein n=1 Tax=Roseofilum acuticapitatum BLCC-M154 TaxID=3022444 RepID=A0ABT7AT34_9CYAN|nr:hypothetical protein [Roseofilum acuticapitatum]MDJ1170072.1 hypothetical protein [Roseofilum acuticapitatum BLCC-M154]
MSTDQDQPTTVEYHDLVAYPPGSESTEQHQWLHFQCENPLQIGNDGTIRCEKCNIQQSALTWYRRDEIHLSETAPEVKQLDMPSVVSFGGQIASIAGAKWLREFLSRLTEEE